MARYAPHVVYQFLKCVRHLGGQFPLLSNCRDKPHPPRGGDRTRSPARVSRKWEYFDMRRETFGEFASQFAGLGAWSPPNRKSPPMVGISPTMGRGFSDHR